MKRITDKQQAINIRHTGIANLYKTGKYTTEQIAKNYGVTVRTVQRVATKYGVIRTQAEANRIAAPLKSYRRLPEAMRVKRKSLTSKIRYQVIQASPECSVCFAKESLEVDHIDNNPSNNELSNLQVLCGRCNRGKSHLDRFGE